MWLYLIGILGESAGRSMSVRLGCMGVCVCVGGFVNVSDVDDLQLTVSLALQE